MKYHIAERDTVEGMVREANELIDNGWAPLGGVQFVPETDFNTPFFVQSFLKAD